MQKRPHKLASVGYRLCSLAQIPKAIKTYCLKLQCIKAFKMLLNLSTCLSLMVICICLRSFLNKVQKVLLHEYMNSWTLLQNQKRKENKNKDSWSQIRNVSSLLTDFSLLSNVIFCLIKDIMQGQQESHSWIISNSYWLFNWSLLD